MFDRNKIKKVSKVVISELLITDHSRGRAGDFRTPRSGTMYIVMQKGKNSLKIETPRAVMPVGNGYFAIIEIFKNKNSGELIGKALTTLYKDQLEVSLNMSFGSYYNIALEYTATEAWSVDDDDPSIYFPLSEWDHFLQMGILDGAEVIQNAVEISKQEINNLILSGYRLLEPRHGETPAKWFKVPAAKKIVPSAA